MFGFVQLDSLFNLCTKLKYIPETYLPIPQMPFNYKFYTSFKDQYKKYFRYNSMFNGCYALEIPSSNIIDYESMHNFINKNKNVTWTIYFESMFNNLSVTKTIYNEKYLWINDLNTTILNDMFEIDQTTATSERNFGFYRLLLTVNDYNNIESLTDFYRFNTFATFMRNSKYNTEPLTDETGKQISSLVQQNIPMINININGTKYNYPQFSNNYNESVDIITGTYDSYINPTHLSYDNIITSSMLTSTYIYPRYNADDLIYNKMFFKTPNEYTKSSVTSVLNVSIDYIYFLTTTFDNHYKILCEDIQDFTR